MRSPHVGLVWAAAGLFLLLGCSQTTARASEQLTTTTASTTASPRHGLRVERSPTALERSVLAEVNRMRRDPAAYADVLRLWQGQYRGELLLVPGQNKAIRTVEGEPALTEAIAVLEHTRALPRLTAVEALARAAGDHVNTQGATRTIGHRGHDGSNSLQRISRHGRSRGRSAEVIDYGWDRAQDIVVDLLVDDGIKDRGHRRALLDPVYVVAGVACGPHQRYGIMCVVEMAERFEIPPVTIASAE
ncbi:MAG: CAP domain-containing protein [Deltaproteobacteria bacterium]|nr:CAP domain-containing protein [Deltaproteobacteria bacterium]